MAIILTDKELQETLAVSGSSATYSVGLEVDSTEVAEAGGLELWLDLTYTSGAFVISLIGDSHTVLDGSSTVIYSLPSIGADALKFLPIPRDAGYKFYGIALTAVAHAGSITLGLQDVSQG